MSQTPTISAIVLAKNEEMMIVNCLETLQWCHEVIVVDDDSTDNTTLLAKRAGAKVITTQGLNFAEKRNKGFANAKGDWIFYIDADERVTPKLHRVILRIIQNGERDTYSIKRNNIHYGKWLQFGGWDKDIVERLFKRTVLKQWKGEVHESAQHSGDSGVIEEPLVHLTHRNMVDGLQKTIDWTGVEAELLFKSGHKKVTARTLFRKAGMEFLRRYIFKKGYKDGIEGCIESLTQAMNKFIIYERLWEMQRNPSLAETYQKIDQTIIEQWEKTEYVKTQQMNT